MVSAERPPIIERSALGRAMYQTGSVVPRFATDLAITSFAFAARQAVFVRAPLRGTSTPMIVLAFMLHQRPRNPCALVGQSHRCDIHRPAAEKSTDPAI